MVLRVMRCRMFVMSVTECRTILKRAGMFARAGGTHCFAVSEGKRGEHWSVWSSVSTTAVSREVWGRREVL